MHRDGTLRSSRRIAAARALVCGALLLVLPQFIAACDSGHGLTVDNRTDDAVVLLESHVVSMHVAPHRQDTLTVLDFNGAVTYTVQTESGRVLYDESLTLKDLDQLHWRIIVGEPTPSPSG